MAAVPQSSQIPPQQFTNHRAPPPVPLTSFLSHRTPPPSEPIRILHVLRPSSPLDILAQPDIFAPPAVPVHPTSHVVTRRVRRQLDGGLVLVLVWRVTPRAVRDHGQVGAHVCRGEYEAPVVRERCHRGRG